jgi:hypothetical protein
MEHCHDWRDWPSVLRTKPPAEAHSAGGHCELAAPCPGAKLWPKKRFLHLQVSVPKTT